MMMMTTNENVDDDDDDEQIVDRADPVEQAEFVAEVRAQNKLSSVTFADDYPVEFHNWREFPVYGTKYEDVYISPNGALFVPPLQTVVPGGLSAVSPSTEAYFPVLKADWNPSDSRAASSVLVVIEEDQFSVLYQDVFLFKRSASATPSTFSTTVFPDGSLRYRYMRIGDKADWTAGVSGNSFVSPTIRNRHVRQSQFIQMDENGLPSAAAPPEAFSATPTLPPSPGAPVSTASNSSDSTSGDDSSEVQQWGEGEAVTIIANGDGAEEEDADTEVTLCRAPTLACLARACGKAGSEVPVLWEGVGCRAAASLNVTFSCRIGGLEVPAVGLGGETTTSSSGSWAGGFEEEAWGPYWAGGEVGGGLVCEVPRLEWAEAGQEEAVMVPVEVLWSLPEQASDRAKEQVRLGAAGVAVHGLSVLGDAGLINSHVLAFRYYRDDADAPDCGCSTSPRQTELTCDSCLVCGGDGSTKDCGGFCHGEASVSPCGECSGGMTGVTGGLWCDEYREYLDGPAEAALLSLSQSIMMLVALSIMTAFLTMCLFLARALMLRGVLAMEGDRHGTLRRRVFSRHRGLSPSELDCLETVEYSTAVSIVSKDKGNDDISCMDGGGDSSGVELIGEKVDPSNSRSSSGSEEKRGGVESAGMMGGGDGAFIAQGAEAASSADCSICLGGFEDGDVLRKLPCLHLFHQKCVDEWLHLSVSCPLCKRSAREGLRRNRRRRRRARGAAQAAAQRAQQHRDSNDSTVPATTTTAPTRTPTPVGAWFRGLPPSLARLFAHSGDGGGGGGGGRGGRRQWQRVDDDSSDGEEKFDDDRGDTGNDDGSPLDGETRRMRVLNANIAAFFGGAEPSPHVSPESLGSSSPGGSISSSTGSSDGGGNAAVGGRSSALRGVFGGNRFAGDGGRRRGGGGASAEYELAPIGPAAAGAAAAAAVAAVDAGVTRNSDIV
ncbi:unnamed protein product [Ectocarpus sp. CCAP 1310/34]|nr:unnamed protein product [Ectocarpus sp. CCAP 1310/34]